MKRLYVHGTSVKSGMAMLDGQEHRPIRSWSCSEYDKIYVRCLSGTNSLGEQYGGLNCTTRDEFVEDVLMATIENANINAAVQNQQDSDKVILHFFEVDDADIEVDTSAPNMLNSFCFHESLVDSCWIGQQYVDSYIPELRFSYIPKNNEFLNLDELGFTDAEQLMMDVLSKDERIFEMTQDYAASAVEVAKGQFEILMKTNDMEREI